MEKGRIRFPARGLKTVTQKINLHPLPVLLILGLLHGGFYLILIPPWQHYDEPTHFEFAWLVAHKGSLPEPGAYDSQMRREVAASMIEHRFFENLQLPNLLVEKPWIGIPQTNDPPLYYLISAGPLWLLKGADITFQLYAVRLVSLCMFLLTLWVSYQITYEIFPKNSFLHWFIPVSLSLTPAFVDLMTAVNNDVGATLFFSVFIWVGIRLLKHGMSILRILSLLFFAIVCLYTKNTVFVAIPLSVFILLLCIFQTRPSWNRFAGPILLVIFGGAFIFLFSCKDAAFWYRNQSTAQSTLPTQVNGIYDRHALAIHFSPEENAELNLSQPLLTSSQASLIGKSYTLGGWIWASEPIQAQAPSLSIDGDTVPQWIQVSDTPTFFTVSGTVSETAQQLNILLYPLVQPLDHSITFYFDNLILAEGQFPPNKIPTLTSDATSGVWDDKPFENLIRNPSTEQKWLTLRPSGLHTLSSQNFIPDYALPAMQDIRLTGPFYRNTVINLFESFWARFGWNHVELPAIWYITLWWFSISGIGVAFVGGVRLVKKRGNTLILFFSWFATCTILIWFAAFARQTLPFWGTHSFTPSARYAFPVIIPTLTIILSGWYLIAEFFPRIKILPYFPIAFLGILDITSFIVIIQFYHLG